MSQTEPILWLHRRWGLLYKTCVILENSLISFEGSWVEQCSSSGVLWSCRHPQKPLEVIVRRVFWHNLPGPGHCEAFNSNDPPPPSSSEVMTIFLLAAPPSEFRRNRGSVSLDCLTKLLRYLPVGLLLIARRGNWPLVRGKLLVIRKPSWNCFLSFRLAACSYIHFGAVSWN